MLVGLTACAFWMCRFLRHLAQKKAQGDLQRVMREFARTAKMYSQKIAASIKLQVCPLPYVSWKRFPQEYGPPAISSIHHLSSVYGCNSSYRWLCLCTIITSSHHFNMPFVT